MYLVEIRVCRLRKVVYIFHEYMLHIKDQSDGIHKSSKKKNIIWRFKLEFQWKSIGIFVSTYAYISEFNSIARFYLW